MTKKSLITTTLVSAAMLALAFSAMAQTRSNDNRPTPPRSPNPTVKSITPRLSPTATSTPGTVKTQLNPTCMVGAITKRDAAVLNAFGMYYDTMKSALQARLTAFKTAWNGTDETARKTAIQTASKAFKDASQKARKDLQNSRQQAWQQFKTDRNACGATGASEDAGTEGLDAQL